MVSTKNHLFAKRIANDFSITVIEHAAIKA
jgi:hypothetical protein